MTTTAWLLLGLAVGLAGWATQAVATSGLFERRQVIAQVLIAWLVPVVGPIVLLVVVRSMKAPLKRRSASAADPDDHAEVPREIQHGQAD